MFRKWFYKMVQQANNDLNAGRYDGPTENRKAVPTGYGMTPAGYNNDLNTNDAPTTVFRVVKAIGGSVIEARRYDPKTDRQATNLYIVNETEDITESLGKVMTMEALR